MRLFSNNLDNIILGLTASFSKFYDLKQEKKFVIVPIPGYKWCNDDKYYPVNISVAFTYFCPNNLVIHYGANRYDKGEYLLFDCFLLNFKTNEITDLSYDLEPQRDFKQKPDGFIKLCSSIEKIEIEKIEKNKMIKIYDQEAGLTELALNSRNQIISLKNETVKTIDSAFLYYSSKLKEISLPKVKEIGEWFMPCAGEIEKIYLPKAKSIESIPLKGMII